MLRTCIQRKKDTRYLCYIRKGSLTVVASREEEKELYNLASYTPFDDRVNYKYDLSVINRNILKDYLTQTYSHLLSNFDNQSTEDILLDLRVIGGPNEDYRPKNIALLMFTDKPTKYIPYSYIDLTMLKDKEGDEIIEKTFDSPLYKQYADCMDYIKNKIIEKKTIKVEAKL